MLAVVMVTSAVAAPPVLSLVPRLAAAQTPDGMGAELRFEEHRLENGLHVVLAPDPSATAVAVNLWYDVGSRHEEPGLSGFAHLFEHLMFQGSEHVAPGAHAEQIEHAGGSLNASASQDRTNFFQTVPPDRLNLALWLEADRMRSLAVSGPNMEREVEVVKEERRLRIDNAPYGTSQLQAGYYVPYDSASCFAYAHSPIGSMRDLDAAVLSDARRFYERYYSPNNATLTVAGAFDAGVALRLVHQYFGGIEGREPPEPVQCEAPFSQLPVERVVEDRNAVLPAVFASYGTVSAADPDAPALRVLARILGSGESSRLHRRLVREEQAALDASAFSDARMGPGLFQVFAIANQGVTGERLLGLLDDELDRMVRQGVTEQELERARNQLESSEVFARQTVMGRAEALQSANHYFGTPDAAQAMIERIRAVTAADVQRVAATYLIPDNRALVRTVPVTEMTSPEAEP